MTPEKILSHKPETLTQAQRQFYFDNGYLLVESIVSSDWVERLIDVTDEMVQRSRSLDKSDMIFDLEPGHTADNPRLRRLTSPVEHHPTYWEFASQSIIVDVAADLVGTGREIPSLKIEFQMGRGRRRGQVAPRHHLLAPHQL